MRNNPQEVFVASPTRQEINQMDASHLIDEFHSAFAAIELSMHHVHAFCKMWTVLYKPTAWSQYHVLKEAVSLPLDGTPKTQRLESEEFKHFPLFSENLNVTLTEVKHAYFRSLQEQMEAKLDTDIPLNMSQVCNASIININTSTMAHNLSSYGVASNGNDAVAQVRAMAKDLMLTKGPGFSPSQICSGGQLRKKQWTERFHELGFHGQAQINSMHEALLLLPHNLELME
jgi:hypothetical protein